MRIFNKYAYLSAVALVGAVGFTACSSDDELTAEPNPTFDGESVKTQFAINIPYAGGQGTRMTAENTQNNNNFLGMDNIRLIAFDGAPEASGVLKEIIATLGDINNGELSSSQSSKIYSNVNVPTHTDHFLFYAKAKGTDKFANGSITPHIDGQSSVNNIYFELEKVNTGSVTTDDEAKLLVQVLNAVDADEVWAGDLDTDLTELRTSLQGLKAGSANNIRLALQNLYNAVERWTMGVDDDNKTAANAIRNAITAQYDSKAVFTLKSPGTDSPYELETTLTYPQNLNLPDGAVELEYASNDFKYKTAGANLTGLTTFDNTKVCYPASLYYFVNTDLAASNSSLENNQWPTTTGNWTSDASAPWLNTATSSAWGTEVLATTRSIALKKNIQYGVASLRFTVKCESGSLPDKAETQGNPNYIPVAAEGFPVTGLLIGGQPERADWEFLPVKGASGENPVFDYTVYDKVAESVNAKEGSAEGTNYTLLLPNYQSTPAKVNFAVELENNTGHEFRGQDGVVPVGGKFYLVGVLDPTDKKVVDTPESGSIEETPDVFMSDYQTTANVTITSLASAYNTIPDLRATQMQLGLSVDLVWKTGISFDVTIGGE